MKIDVRPCEYAEVQNLRELYRQELNCQIKRDSFLARGLADGYLICIDGRIAGYGAVANKYDKGRLIEFYTLSERRQMAVPMCQELLAVSRATHIEAQTNNPLMVLVLFDCAKNVKAENVLFADAFSSNLSCPAGQFRHTTTGDGVEDEWLVEAGGQVVASGGFLCHYNPPYGDIYMQVSETARRRGIGSYFVQEVKRVCYEAGKKPAARCDADNVASRKTLEKAGMLPCGRLLVGKVALAPK